MALIATLILLLPLFGFLAVLILGSSLKERSVGAIATGVVAISFVLSVVVLVLLLHHSNREATAALLIIAVVGAVLLARRERATTNEEVSA